MFYPSIVRTVLGIVRGLFRILVEKENVLQMLPILEKYRISYFSLLLDLVFHFRTLDEDSYKTFSFI